MSACAGSSTERTKVCLLRFSGTVRTAREVVFSISPARSGWIAPGRIGFMSTQRRECRIPRSRSRLTVCMEQAQWFGLKSPTPVPQFARALAGAGMAPPSFSAGLAALALQSDHRNTQLARLAPFSFFRASAPPGAGSRARKPSRLCFQGHPHRPSLSCLARLHPSLPRVPTALGCRTERYDGKRDMYLQHAA